MDKDLLLIEKPGEDKFRFHGVQASTLEELISQSEEGKILPWGTDHNEFVDGEIYYEYFQGEGYLFATDWSGIELSFSEFCGDGGIVLVLEKIVDEPQEWFPRPSDRRERLIRVEEWKVICGLRPVFDEDGDVIDQEVVSIEEM